MGYCQRFKCGDIKTHLIRKKFQLTSWAGYQFGTCSNLPHPHWAQGSYILFSSCHSDARKSTGMEPGPQELPDPLLAGGSDKLVRSDTAARQPLAPASSTQAANLVDRRQRCVTSN